MRARAWWQWPAGEAVPAEAAMHPYRSPPNPAQEQAAPPADADGGFLFGVALLLAISVGRIAVAVLHSETWGVEPTVALLVVAFCLYFCRGRR
jgi:hypothetical protein